MVEADRVGARVPLHELGAAPVGEGFRLHFIVQPDLFRDAVDPCLCYRLPSSPLVNVHKEGPKVAKHDTRASIDMTRGSGTLEVPQIAGSKWRTR